jgi:ADP-ribose pyrophosphatase YjhB (NUDIX family)
MSVSEPSTWEGRRLNVSWIAAPARPPRALVTQASGVCFTEDGRIVLVAGPDRRWALPGGHLRPGETTEEAFVREVQEEACVVVRHLAYLGAQQVDDPESAARPRRTYQVRFWARVTLQPFEPRFETRDRTLVAPAVFVETLAWRTVRIAGALLEAALAEEARFRGCGGGWFREELGEGETSGEGEPGGKARPV